MGSGPCRAAGGADTRDALQAGSCCRHRRRSIPQQVFPAASPQTHPGAVLGATPHPTGLVLSLKILPSQVVECLLAAEAPTSQLAVAPLRGTLATGSDFFFFAYSSPRWETTLERGESTSAHPSSTKPWGRWPRTPLPRTRHRAWGGWRQQLLPQKLPQSQAHPSSEQRANKGFCGCTPAPAEGAR